MKVHHCCSSPFLVVEMLDEEDTDQTVIRELIPLKTMMVLASGVHSVCCNATAAIGAVLVR